MSDMSENSWIEHDGSWPRPSELVVGLTATVLYRDGKTKTDTFRKLPEETPIHQSCWNWLGNCDDIIAYRICKPDAKEARRAVFQSMLDGVKTKLPEGPKRTQKHKVKL